MRVQLMTAVAVCLTVSACSDSKAPDISLDSKLKCSMVAEAKMQGDNGTVIRLVNSALEAAATDYKGDSDIEYYFQNVIRTEPSPRTDLQRAVMNQCIADTGASISGTFREALTESYERNGEKLYFASCKAFNKGVIDSQKIKEEFKKAEAFRATARGSQAMGVDLDAESDGYIAKIKSSCESDPSQRLQVLINNAINQQDEAERQAKANQDASAAAAYLVETTKLVAELDAAIKAQQPISCSILNRVNTDRHEEIREKALATMERAIEATLAKHSLEYAAAARADMDGSSIDLEDCAANNWTLDQELAERLGADSIENAQKRLGYSFMSAVNNERAIRSQSQGNIGDIASSRSEESEEMQMERASKADMEDALYRERQAQEQSN